MKGYVTPGPAPSPEPLPKVAALLGKSQWTLVGSVGGGVKVKVREHIVLRRGQGGEIVTTRSPVLD